MADRAKVITTTQFTPDGVAHETLRLVQEIVGVEPPSSGDAITNKMLAISQIEIKVLLTEINNRLIDAELNIERLRYANPDMDAPPLLGLRQRIKDRYG